MHAAKDNSYILILISGGPVEFFDRIHADFATLKDCQSCIIALTCIYLFIYLIRILGYLVSSLV